MEHPAQTGTHPRLVCPSTARVPVVCPSTARVNPDTQIGVGIDPGVTQAVSAASGVWDPMTGQLQADQLRRWKLTKGEVKHASGLNNARRDTERWLAPIKPHLQHLAAASSAGTSLEANQKHITVTLATWDAVWEVYLDPKWARQRLRLYGAQDRALEQFFNKLEEDMAELSMKRHGHAKQLVVFFGAATIGTGGGWGADAVLRACRKVVCRPRGKDQDGDRVVLVDEHRTSRVSSAVNGKQPCEVELNTLSATRPAGWKPTAGQVEERLWPPAGPHKPHAAAITPQPAKRSKRTKAEPAAEPTKGKGKAAKAKPAPQPGRWLDRDCNAALNMQRIGESKWRPLELCYWPDQGALPAKGKEYPGLGYKRLRDKPPKAQEQQQPAEAHISAAPLEQHISEKVQSASASATSGDASAAVPAASIVSSATAPAAAPSARLAKRVFFGLMLGLGGGAVVLAGQLPFLATIILVTYGATQEYYGFITSKGMAQGMVPPPPLVSSLTTVLCTSIALLAYFYGRRSGTVLAVSSILLLVMEVVTIRKPKFSQLTSCVFGLFYCGKRLGRTKLTEISPKKTVEGALGGLASSVAVALGCWKVSSWPATPAAAAVLGVLVFFSSLFGDLIESIMKRDAGMKDSGDLIPGHGGLLDRVDSYMFTGAVTFFYVVFVLPYFSL
ncbi:hypothetical protein QJQ45_010718 [Haematococcus lacustris]|nr:hypothetical protein QJQ45_010718 [Haematococcus lacustris]